jgi:hypothetical protein
MIGSKLGLKALGLCGLVLALAQAALAGNAAQAETGAKWKVKGADVGTLGPQLAIKEIENNSLSLSFMVFGKPRSILCTAVEIDEGGKLIGNGGISLGRLLFKGCLISGEATKCKPHSPGRPFGEILSERGTGLIVLDKLTDGTVAELVKLTPENAKGEPSKLLAIIEFGEFCVIGEEARVETTELGEGLWIKNSGGNVGFLTETITHLFEEGLSKLLADGQPAKLIGSTLLELSGEHKGLQWSGVPA